MEFPCIACGLCCENARFVPELQNLLNEKGQCRYYDPKTKKCSIYSHRPTICNTTTMYEQRFCTSMTEKDYLLANLAVCCKLSQAAGYKGNVVRLCQIMEEIIKS